MTQQLPTDKDAKGEVLRAARFAPLLRTAKSEQATQLIDTLSEELISFELDNDLRQRRPRPNDLATLKRTIGAFIADLVLHSENEEGMGFLYRSDNKDDFAETVATYRQFKRVRTALQALGYLEIVKGIRVMDDFDGAEYELHRYASRYRATLALLDLATEQRIKVETIDDHFEVNLKLMFPVILREPKTKGSTKPGKRVRINKTKGAMAIAEDVRDVNEFISKFDFNLSEPPIFRRIFSNGTKEGYLWDQGGRLYSIGAGSYQQMNREDRRKITINGEKTVELDLRASHLTILDAKAGKPLPSGDPYWFEDIDRDVVKFLVTAMTGKGDIPGRWNRELAADFEARTGEKLNSVYPLSKTAQRVLERLPILDLMRKTGLDTFRLQYIEAEIIMNTILRLIRDFNVPALPVHDSLIVRETDEELVKDILTGQFRQMTGVDPTINVK